MFLESQMKTMLLMFRRIEILYLHIPLENYILPLDFLTQFPLHWLILKVSLGIGISNSSDEIEKILRGLLYTFQNNLCCSEYGTSKGHLCGITQLGKSRGTVKTSELNPTPCSIVSKGGEIQCFPEIFIFLLVWSVLYPTDTYQITFKDQPVTFAVQDVFCLSVHFVESWQDYRRPSRQDGAGQGNWCCSLLCITEWSQRRVGKAKIRTCMSMQMRCGEFFKQIQTNKRKLAGATSSLKYFFGE